MNAAGSTRRLILVSGREGAGKSTIIRALLPETPYSAAVDAEDVGQVRPCLYDHAFFDLLRRNVAGLVQNYWGAGYVNVITGSFFSTFSDYIAFRGLLATAAEVYIVHLSVEQDVRESRRLTRAKQTTQQWRDTVDQMEVEDATIRLADGDYQYIEIDNTLHGVAETVALVKDAIPDIYSRV